MLIAAIETATADVGVALHDGTQLIGAVSLSIGPRHAEALLPALAHLLEQSGRQRTELTHLAVDRGPGLFTGLRVGVATARTLAMALGLPLVGIGSLEAVAADSVRDGLVATLLDARRREVYGAVYRVTAGTPIEVLAPFVAAPVAASDLLAAHDVAEGLLLAGDAAGSDAFAGLGRVVRCCRPSAGAVAQLAVEALGRGDARLDPFELDYLRAPDAQITWDNRYGPAARS